MSTICYDLVYSTFGGRPGEDSGRFILQLLQLLVS